MPFRATRILIADLRQQKKYERIFTKFKTTGLLFIESRTFQKVMNWIITTYVKVEANDNDILACVYERLMGVAIGEENINKKIAYLDILHDRSINVFV